MTTTRYAVTGLTCGYCIAEVVEHVRDLVGVTGVAVDLVKGGPSPVIVTAGPAVAIGQIREAVGEAGFNLTGEWMGQGEKGAAPVVNLLASRSTYERVTTKGVSR